MSARELLRGVRVAPSILSADFGRLREQVGEVLDAGARMIHVDVMDGHFVPQITLGPVVVAALAEQARAAGAMLDVHLMIERPERHIGEFVQPAPTRSPSTPRRRPMSPMRRALSARAARASASRSTPAPRSGRWPRSPHAIDLCCA